MFAGCFIQASRAWVASAAFQLTNAMNTVLLSPRVPAESCWATELSRTEGKAGVLWLGAQTFTPLVFESQLSYLPTL